MAGEAQCKIMPIVKQIHSYPAGSRNNHTGLPINVFQTVTVAIRIDRMVGTFISLIGSVLTVNVILVCIMTVEAVDFMTGHIETISCIITDYIRRIGSLN